MIILEYSSPKDFTFRVQDSNRTSPEDLEPGDSCCWSSSSTNTSFANVNVNVNSDSAQVLVLNPPLTPTFDEILCSAWDKAQRDGLFNYQLFSRGSGNSNGLMPVPMPMPRPGQELPEKILRGKYNFIAQLNPDRALKRRKPQEIQNLNQPFNPIDFHFGQVKAEEKILILKPRPQLKSSNAEIEAETTGSNTNDHTILINVSPLEYGHVLLVPSLSLNQPQRITLEGLNLAVELLLLSSSCDFRVGFNSLCGYASVNHHHFHAYYLKHRLFLEHAELRALSNHGSSQNSGLRPCQEIIDYPAPGFAFSIGPLNVTTTTEEIDNCIKNAFRLTSYLQNNNIAHNVYITRGSSINKIGHFDSVRIFIWGRTPSYGAKENDAFNPALCELSGHFPIKNQPAYETLTEELICQKLSEISKETFEAIRPRVIELFSDV